MVKAIEDMNKEELKEWNNYKKSQLAWMREYMPEELGSKEIIEKEVVKEIEKIVDNPKHLEEIKKLNEILGFKEKDIEGYANSLHHFTEEKEKLNEINADLLTQNSLLNKENLALNTDIETLKKEIAELKATKTKLQKALNELSIQ